MGPGGPPVRHANLAAGQRRTRARHVRGAQELRPLPPPARLSRLERPVALRVRLAPGPVGPEQSRSRRNRGGLRRIQVLCDEGTARQRRRQPGRLPEERQEGGGGVVAAHQFGEQQERVRRPVQVAVAAGDGGFSFGEGGGGHRAASEEVARPERHSEEQLWAGRADFDAENRAAAECAERGGGDRGATD